MKTLSLWRKVKNMDYESAPKWLASKEPPEVTFHKKRMVEPKHWRYLGHDIKRSPHFKNRWTIYPKVANTSMNEEWKRLEWLPSLHECCQRLFSEYTALLWETVEIEKERHESKRY